MFSTLRRQRERDGGFTLLELMVVVLVIAILIAIAIPTFLGARRRAQDRAAQSNLRNALMVEKSIYADARAYSSNVTATGPLTTGERSLTFRANGSMPATTAGSVYVYVPAGGASVRLGARSASGRCFYLMDVASGTGVGTFYGQTPPAPRQARPRSPAPGGPDTWRLARMRQLLRVLGVLAGAEWGGRTPSQVQPG